LIAAFPRLSTQWPAGDPRSHTVAGAAPASHRLPVHPHARAWYIRPRRPLEM